MFFYYTSGIRTITSIYQIFNKILVESMNGTIRVRAYNQQATMTRRTHKGTLDKLILLGKFRIEEIETKAAKDRSSLVSQATTGGHVKPVTEEQKPRPRLASTVASTAQVGSTDIGCSRNDARERLGSWLSSDLQ